MMQAVMHKVMASKRKRRQRLKSLPSHKLKQMTLRILRQSSKDKISPKVRKPYRMERIWMVKTHRADYFQRTKPRHQLTRPLRKVAQSQKRLTQATTARDFWS